MRHCCRPLLSFSLLPFNCTARRVWQKSVFFYFSSSAKFQGTEFICARRFGLGEMKYNRGGPGARWGDVSTEGKQLFVCLSLTLGLPFISLQGCGAVFTPGQLSFCVSLLCPSFFFFMSSLKASLDHRQGWPSKRSSPIFAHLVAITPTLPLKSEEFTAGRSSGNGSAEFNLGIQTC